MINEQDYKSVVLKLCRAELDLAGLQSAHQQYVVHYLIDLAEKLAQYQIYVDWVTIQSTGFETWTYNVSIIMDGLSIASFDVDSFSPGSFHELRSSVDSFLNEILENRGIYLKLSSSLPNSNKAKLKSKI